jgi:hypothetical protein
MSIVDVRDSAEPTSESLPYSFLTSGMFSQNFRMEPSF